MGNPLVQTKKMEKNIRKKRNFPECELETLLSEVEAKKNTSFGTLSSGINSKRKKWSRSISENHTGNDLKNKDREVEVKQRSTAHPQSLARTSGGSGVDGLTSFALHRVGCNMPAQCSIPCQGNIRATVS